MSLLYITQNALLSCMLVAEEWSGFAADRKTLRVSAPVGIQRSQYSLSMPMRYAIPMMIVFAIEHWLLSQSTFIIRANRVSWNGDHVQGWTIAGYNFVHCLTGKQLAPNPKSNGTLTDENDLSSKSRTSILLHCCGATSDRRKALHHSSSNAICFDM